MSNRIRLGMRRDSGLANNQSRISNDIQEFAARKELSTALALDAKSKMGKEELPHATAVAKSLPQNAVEYLISVASHQDAFARALAACRMPHCWPPLTLVCDICLLLVAHSVCSAANCMAYRKMQSILLIRRWPTTNGEGLTHIANGLIFAQFVITTDWPIRFCKRLAMPCKYLQLLTPPPPHTHTHMHSYMHRHSYSYSYAIYHI